LLKPGAAILSLEKDFFRKIPQVEIRSHAPAVSSGAENSQKVTPPRDGHRNLLTEDITRFTDVPGDGHLSHFAAPDAAAVDDFMIGFGIDGGPGQAVERSSADTGKKLAVAIPP
jgi:hypothetical protein